MWSILQIILNIRERVFKVVELFMSSREKWSRCGFMGCCWLGVREHERETDRDRGMESRKRECEGGRYVMLAKPLSETLIHLATARWWSEYKRPPTPVSDLRPALTSEMNSAVLAKSTPRQEGWAVVGENTHRQTYAQTHMLVFRPNTYRYVYMHIGVCAYNTWTSSNVL